jgi:hypothetical protein
VLPGEAVVGAERLDQRGVEQQGVEIEDRDGDQPRASTSSAAAHGAMARLRERWPTLPVTVT